MTRSDLPLRPGPTLENLTNRYSLFQAIRDSHMRWMDRTQDPHLKEIHQVLVEQLEAILEQYNVLIDALQSKP